MFNMMDDGLSVCVPDDPTGNAKLMFSILECLPKSYRNTVLYLMDHIKLIHLNSDRNKMTSQALAICFGPLFSCYDQSESVYKPIQMFKFLLDIWPRRKGAFSLLKKLEMNKTSAQSDHFNLKTPLQLDNWSSNQTKSSISSEISHFSNLTTSINSLHSNTLLITTTTPTYNLTLNTSEGTTTTATWNTSGTGRMLPSTQSVTQTMNSYTSTANSISKNKAIVGISALSTSTNTTTSANVYGSDLLSSGTYRSRLLTTITTSSTASKSTTINSTINSSDGYISKSYSSRYTCDSSTNSRPILYSSSEVIDQTYKKYLTPSTTALVTCLSTSCSSTEGLYSTVNKTTLKLSSTYHSDECKNLNMDGENNNNYFSSKRSHFSDDILISSHYLPSKTTADSLDIEKPLISGPSATQLYPSRLISSTEASGGQHSIISSSYTTGYSNNYTPSLYGNTDFSSSENSTGSLSNKLPTMMRNYDFESESNVRETSITSVNESFNEPVTTNTKLMLNDNLESTKLADLKNSDFDSYGDDNRTNIISTYASRTSMAGETTATTSTSYHYRNYENKEEDMNENVM